YLISLILLWKLMGQVDLLPPSISGLQLNRFLKNGFLLLLRVIAATICVTLAASFAARLGTTSMAAFQICLQVWLATSLLADGLAVAGQFDSQHPRQQGKQLATANNVFHVLYET
ncbi:Protein DETOXIFICATION 42, partial [Sarracenia purpurea var. burkii]